MNVKPSALCINKQIHSQGSPRGCKAGEAALLTLRTENTGDPYYEAVAM